MGERRTVRSLDEQADDRSHEDADEDAALDLQDHEGAGDDDADDPEEGGSVRDVTEGDEGGVVVGDDAGVLQADEGDEQADTRADGLLQSAGNGAEQPAADFGNGKDNEQDTFQENSRKGELPGVTHAQAYGEHEESVQAHTGSQCERLLGIESHHQRTDDGSQGGGGEHAAGRHAGKSAEDAGIHGQDVGHGKESGNARKDFRAHTVHLRIKTKEFLESRFHFMKH